MKNIEEIDKVMEEIEYGWIDKEGNRHEELEGFGDNYMLQMPEELLESKLGVCWDQVELERKLFTDMGIRVRTFFIVYYDEDTCPTHTFVTFEDEGKVYWYEYSWFPMRGLHEYENISEALDDIRVRFIDGTIREECDQDNLVIYEYEAPNRNLSCPEFYAHCENGKKIKL